MSAIAEFILLPRSILPDLLEMANEPDYHSFLQSNGKAVVDFRWSGWVFNPLLPYLSKQIDMRSKNFEFASLAQGLIEATGTLHEIYAAKEKNEFLPKLNPDSFSSEALRDYYDKFNQANEADAGDWMLAGIRALRDGLSRVDESSALLLTVG
jgi:hypothetical protein